MSKYDDPIFEEEEDRTLLIDGDILVYKPCCIFTDDDEHSKEMIGNNIKNKISQLCEAAGCTSFLLYMTTKLNFRDFIADDYKANRIDVERPVNLSWAKMFAVKELGAEYVKYLEADDLLAINQKQDGSTVIWSLDKDLRQVPGLHLDDDSQKVITIDELGELYEIPNKKPKKHYFTGFIGLMFQALVGDTADYIIGCGIRELVETKSGPNKGVKKLRRVGVGPAAAFKMFELVRKTDHCKEAYKNVVRREYYKLHGDNWQKELEKQVNLLYMVRHADKDGLVRQWTFDNRISMMDINDGEIYNDGEDNKAD